MDTPRELVFEAFTEARHLSRWWGSRWVHDHHAGVRVPRRRGVGLRDARAGRREACVTGSLGKRAEG
ncbi:SRPBCC domain-containing protein [Actinomadura sp. NPDC048021]|uniref:SRPBCC domain-containing protein n=1 Tax=Actinomadura sp. NPDC048021 TaxID=3155385 RepID=UPI003408086F